MPENLPVKKVTNPDNLPMAYVSVAMDGISGENKDVAIAAYKFLCTLNYWVYIPHWLKKAVDKQVSSAQDKHYLGFRLSVLSRCEIMVLLPGWESSKDCNDELRFALMQNIPVFLLIDNELVDFDTINYCEICNVNHDKISSENSLREIIKENEIRPVPFTIIAYVVYILAIIEFVNILKSLYHLIF